MSVRSLATLVAFAILSVPALAQQAGAPAAAASSAASEECVKAPAPHDHGAERNVPTPRKPCQAAADTGGSKQPAQKPVTGHDHGKVHKNQ